MDEYEIQKNEIKKEFLSKLYALMTEYNAEIEAEDCFMGYAECGEDIRIHITLKKDNNYNHLYSAPEFGSTCP